MTPRTVVPAAAPRAAGGAGNRAEERRFERPRKAVRTGMQWALLVLVVAVLFFAWRAGVFARLDNPKQFAHELAAMGPRGYFIFVLAYACFQPFGVPGTAFVMAAPLIWPWQLAFTLSMVGTVSASVVGFSFARFVGRDWVSARIPERFKRYDIALERHAFRTIFLLRLVFWMPQALHFFLGVSRVPFWTHLWASALGYATPLLLLSYFGGSLIDWL